MSNISTQRGIASGLQVAGSAVHTAVTAAGSGDTTAINGATIDRLATGKTVFQSAMAAASFRATMASGESLVSVLKFQDSANDSDWTDFGAGSGVVTVVSAVGGAATAKQGHQKLGVDLTTARRYVRAVCTPDLSRAGTDTATVELMVVLGGAQDTPRVQPTASLATLS
jgi:hypothetical protein